MNFHHVLPRVLPEDGCGSTVCADQSQQNTNRGGLPGPVGTQEAVNLAGLDSQIESGERLKLAKGLRELPDLNSLGQCHSNTPAVVSGPRSSRYRS